MKKLLIACLTLLLLCSAVNAYALSAAVQAAVSTTYVAAASPHCDSGTADGGGGTVVRCDDFEGSTDCYSGTSVCRAGWDYASTMTWNQSTVKLEGNYSASTGAGQYFRDNFTASDNFYGYSLFEVDAVGTSSYNYLVTLTGSTNNVCRVQVSGGKLIVLNASGTTQTSVTGLADDTKYSLWFWYEKTGAGAGICGACFDTTTTKPTGNNCAVSTDGAGTSQVDRVEFGDPASGGLTYFWDHIRTRTSTAFGNNPD